MKTNEKNSLLAPSPRRQPDTRDVAHFLSTVIIVINKHHFKLEISVIFVTFYFTEE